MKRLSVSLLDRLIGYAPVAAMIVLLLLAGWAVLDWPGALAMAVAVLLVVFSVSRLAHSHAVRTIHDAPRRKRLSPGFEGKLADLGRNAGFRQTPELGFIDGMPNAFVWRGKEDRKPRLLVAETLHDLLSERQLLAVLAHELAHVRAGDSIRIATGEVLGRMSMLAAVGALFAGAAVYLLSGRILAPNWVWWTLAFGPTVLSALHHAASRRAEFRADAEAGRLTGDPAALSQALARIRFVTGAVSLRDTIEEYAGLRGRGWWRTHPDVEDRINRLQRAAGRAA